MLEPYQTCVAGVGLTDFTRRSDVSPGYLAVKAILAACEDAGITPEQIDACIPFHTDRNVEMVMASLGIEQDRVTALVPMGGAGSIASLQLAAAMIGSGAAETVLFYVARNSASESRVASRAVAATKSEHYRRAFEFSYGVTVPVQWSALSFARHAHEFGTTKDDLATIAVTQRAHAQLNPHAQMNGRTLTVEQYHDARVISAPLQLFDCSLETDGAAAIILTRAGRAGDGPHAPVYIGGVAAAHPQCPDDTVNRADFFEIGLRKAAPRAFAMAGLEHADVSAAMIYDPFTFEVIHQLEEAGFCGRGEGGAFIRERGIGLGGGLPINTHGGLLSEGHAAGLNHVVEATRQLRGQCGDRQVAEAKVVAVSGWTHFGDSGFALLTNFDGGGGTA